MNTHENHSPLKSHTKKNTKIRLQQSDNSPKKRPVTDAFNACTELSNQMETSKIASDTKTTELLAKTLHFYQLGNLSKKNKQIYTKLLLKKDIKITRSTKNPYTPAVKAFFGTTQKTNVGRFAAALHNAGANRITPEKFESFVQESGGLVACAKAGAELLNPDKATQDAQRRKESFQKLQSTASQLKVSDLKDKLPKGPASLLVHKNTDGSVLLLGYNLKIASPGHYEPLV